MKYLSILFATAILVQPESFAANDTTMSPQDFVNLYERALGTQEWAKVDPLIHPDCTVTFSNGTSHEGKEKVQSAFQRNFDLIKSEEYSISELHWVAETPDFAVFTFSFSWSGIIDGREASGMGRGTSALIRVEEGWQLISEHLGPKS